MTVAKVDAIAASQAEYVQKLADMFNSGITTLRVYDEVNYVWTLIPLQPFWQIQQDLLLSQQLYSSKLNEAKTEAQTSADAKLLDVIVPPMEGFK